MYKRQAIKLRKSNLENNSLKKVSENLKQEITQTNYQIIGQSSSMLEVLDVVHKVAGTDANILITGENGTGKELIAQEIHRLSKRKGEILLSVDVGSISENLFESELFGHKKGAFTDAKYERIGKIEAANKGSLFLDEIANIPLSLQAKLLNVIQNRTITKIGDNKAIPVDIRLICATNKNLENMVEKGSFRADLLYRINTIKIELPPLRERDNDIILLAEFFLDKYSKKYDKPGLKISKKAKRKLLKYNWPGNVRELQHSVEKAVILSENSILDDTNFTLNQQPKIINKSFQNLTLEEMEKIMITNCIDKEKGNMSNVAKKLGITRQTLYNKLKKYGI